MGLRGGLDSLEVVLSKGHLASERGEEGCVMHVCHTDGDLVFSKKENMFYMWGCGVCGLSMRHVSM
jgi:hypothetical protein